MLVLMCRDPGDATSKVSYCVETSYCFKNRDFARRVWHENKNTVNLKSDSFIVIMLLHKGLTHIYSQKKPGLHFGESFQEKDR